MSKNKENFLDYIPKHNSLFPYTIKENGKAEIQMFNRGIAKKITQVLLKKPKYSYIELDEFGTFVWNQIDGKTTVYDIGQRVKEQFGEKAEPLYERLTQYIRKLRVHRFILYVNLTKEGKNL